MLLTASGQAKLADVGLARVLHGGDYTRLPCQLRAVLAAVLLLTSRVH